MAPRPPQKGSVEWVPIPDAPEEYKDVLIGIKYVGDESFAWGIEAGVLDEEERNRTGNKVTHNDLLNVFQLVREGLKDKLDEEAVNELIVSVAETIEQRPTSEYSTAWLKHTKEVLASTVSGVRGLDGVKDDDAPEALALIEYLGVHKEIYTAARLQQSLKLRQIFRAARDSSG